MKYFVAFTATAFKCVRAAFITIVVVRILTEFSMYCPPKTALLGGCLYRAAMEIGSPMALLPIVFIPIFMVLGQSKLFVQSLLLTALAIIASLFLFVQFS